MPPTNSFPTRSTWLLAQFLARRKLIYCQDTRRGCSKSAVRLPP